MPLATSAASKSSMLPRACPDSARAIISSALKVRIRPSDSSMVRSSAARYSASLPELASASSARLRSRVSGVFRSWAMLSETSFRPIISASMRSSMALRFSASRSSSSPLRPTGSRPERSPAMMRWVVPVMASIRRSTRRATKMPPPRPSTMTTSSDHCAALATMPNSRRRSSRSRPISSRKPLVSSVTRTSARWSALSFSSSRR